MLQSLVETLGGGVASAVAGGAEVQDLRILTTSLIAELGLFVKADLRCISSQI